MNGDTGDPSVVGEVPYHNFSTDHVDNDGCIRTVSMEYSNSTGQRARSSAGKRKFESEGTRNEVLSSNEDVARVGDDTESGGCSSDHTSNRQPFGTTDGRMYYEQDSNRYRSHEPTEAGLSLLFAASLIQQKGDDRIRKSDHSRDCGNVGYMLPEPSFAESSRPVSDYFEVGNDNVNGNGSSLQPRLNERLMSSSSSSNADGEDSIITDITEKDVLCGRGGGINKHTGNVIYRRVVEHNKTIYKQVPKRHRMLVSQSIVQAVINWGGRFLQQQHDRASSASEKHQTWKEIQFRRAVQKTSQALRERNDDDGSIVSKGTKHDGNELDSLSVTSKGEQAKSKNFPRAKKATNPMEYEAFSRRVSSKKPTASTVSNLSATSCAVESDSALKPNSFAGRNPTRKGSVQVYRSATESFVLDGPLAQAQPTTFEIQRATRSSQPSASVKSEPDNPSSDPDHRAKCCNVARFNENSTNINNEVAFAIADLITTPIHEV